MRSETRLFVVCPALKADHAAERGSYQKARSHARQMHPIAKALEDVFKSIHVAGA